MNNLIIKKWIEPYRLLETIKKYSDLTDYTFDGSNKIAQKKKMYSDIEENPDKFGLYMKNVNKFYVFGKTDKNNLKLRLIEVFEFNEDDYETTQDCESALSMIDMGKAEASFINF